MSFRVMVYHGSIQIIRIFCSCEVWIEIFVTRVTVRHHEACPSDAEQLSQASWCRTVIPSDRIFNSHRTTTIIDSFSCILFLRRLYLILSMRYFINFTLKYVHFRYKKMFSSVPIYDVLTACTKSSYMPSCKTEISRTGGNRGKPFRVCKKM